jgi:glutamine cyclotransferase
LALHYLIMHNKFKLVLIAATLFALGCKHPETNITMSPEAGTSYKAGDQVTVKVNFDGASKVDSIVYLIDSAKLLTRRDSSAISFKTDTMTLGVKVITARLYQDGKNQELSTNIILKAAKPAEEYTYVVDKKYHHDTTSYTEGLEYHDGYFYESSGGYLKPPPGEVADQQSSLRKVDPETGKIVKKIELDPAVFGEGIAIIGNKIIQLTYREKIGYIYDLNSFKLLGTFSDTVDKEGWGLCFDGKKIYNTDGTNRIWFLNKDNYQPTGYIDVYDDKGEIDSVNELEYVDGKLYANIYQKDTILVIDPKTGAVLEKVDMKNIYPEKDRPENFDEGNNVLNGIAWDDKGKRLFVTGKKWPYMYQVRFVPKK